MENTFVLLLLVFQMKNIVRGFRSPNRFLILSGILYIIGLAIFLAVSTPNFGTLVRYKAGFWFLLIYLILADHPIFTFTKTKS